MGNKKAEPVVSSAVVMTPRRVWSRRSLTILVSIVVLVVLAVGLLWYMQKNDNQSTRPNDTKALVNDPQYQEAQKSDSKLRASGSHDEAKAVWQKYIDGDYSEEEKYKAYLKLAALDETKGDCKAALIGLREAEKLTDRAQRAEYQAIARCSEKLNDWTTAQSYYQKALENLPKGQEYDSDRRYYQRKVDTIKQKTGA